MTERAPEHIAPMESAMEEPIPQPRPWLAADQRDAAGELWRACETKQAALIEGTLQALRSQPAFASSLAASPELQHAAGCVLIAHLQRGLQGDWSGYSQCIREHAGHARLDTRPSALQEIAKAVRTVLLPELVNAQRVAAVQALQSVLDESVSLMIDELMEARLRAERESPMALAMRSDQLKFQRLYDSGITGILICDTAGNIEQSNECFLRMVGYTRQELMSGQVRWADMTPDEWKAQDESAIEQLQARGYTRTWEKEYFRKDGSRVPILVGVAMLTETTCIAFTLDITERKDLGLLRIKSLQLEAQNHRIRESSRLKSEFLANMSHELRTPLNSIIGFADLLYDGDIKPDSPQHHEFLGDILKSGRHLLQLINDVLDLAKVEAGKLEFRPEKFDLAHLISEVTTVVRAIAYGKRINIEIDVASDVTEVKLDPARLKQVLYNYISNALKFTPDGGRVWVRTRAEGPDCFRVEVEDNGQGIAEADLGRLFVEFQQLDAGTTKRHAGTGLGLALTKRIVEGQHGTVGVTSEVGKGSIFFAVLPRETEASGADELVETVALAPEGWTRVLVVEDDVADRNVLVQALNGAGYGVEVALTGQQAIEACQRSAYDMITLDLLLPDMIGLDVLHRIREAGKNRETPVVVVSVAAEEGTVTGFLVHDYLRKPIDGPVLLNTLRIAKVPPTGGRIIFAVDDDLAALKLLEVNLGLLGYGVRCFTDGQSALLALALESPDAVILDLMMPRMDGFEFLNLLRQHTNCSTLPVIVWTMKELTNGDHARLSGLAQDVLGKGRTQPQPLLEQLRIALAKTLSEPVSKPEV
jgi:PAS domain S-box-containing protein